MAYQQWWFQYYLKSHPGQSFSVLVWGPIPILGLIPDGIIGVYKLHSSVRPHSNFESLTFTSVFKWTYRKSLVKSQSRGCCWTDQPSFVAVKAEHGTKQRTCNVTRELVQEKHFSQQNHERPYATTTAGSLRIAEWRKKCHARLGIPGLVWHFFLSFCCPESSSCKISIDSINAKQYNNNYYYYYIFMFFLNKHKAT